MTNGPDTTTYKTVNYDLFKNRMSREIWNYRLCPSNFLVLWKLATSCFGCRTPDDGNESSNRAMSDCPFKWSSSVDAKPQQSMGELSCLLAGGSSATKSLISGKWVLTAPGQTDRPSTNNSDRSWSVGPVTSPRPDLRDDDWVAWKASGLDSEKERVSSLLSHGTIIPDNGIEFLAIIGAISSRTKVEFAEIAGWEMAPVSSSTSDSVCCVSPTSALHCNDPGPAKLFRWSESSNDWLEEEPPSRDVLLNMTVAESADSPRL